MATHATGADSYVLFELAGATYAVRSDDIQQLEMVAPPTPVPNAPPYVEGVVSIRGQVIPAVSLRARFGFPPREATVRSRLVIVRTNGRTVGLIVDSAREFATIRAEEIEPLPDGIGGLGGRYLRGVAHRDDRLMLIIDVAELLAGDADAAAHVGDPVPHDAVSVPTSN